jgi:hypothetical protein
MVPEGVRIMLIPNAKFLVLPLVALAVIASLATRHSQATQGSAETIVVPATLTAGCGQAPAGCRVVADSAAVAIR